jgi:agmatine deiminase
MTLKPPAPEWARHKAVWIGFPSHPELWAEDLEPARREVAAFARAVHAEGRGEKVLLVAADAEAAMAAQRAAGDVAQIVTQPFGDIWLRDTGPIVRSDGIAASFAFNGWGGKYDLPGDDDLGPRLAEQRRIACEEFGWILEGGAIDGDGSGLVVTTEQCLLNPNRNPGMSRSEIEAHLKSDLGYNEVIWLGDGLHNDHTDGHVDNLARFVAPGVLAIPDASDNDPNWRVYQDAAQRAARVDGIQIVRLPSPGRVIRDGEVIPASHMNFYIGNAAVVVPAYGGDSDAAAVAAIARLFPDREVVGLRADAILTGGGSFHCISQQIPA